MSTSSAVVCPRPGTVRGRHALGAASAIAAAALAAGASFAGDPGATVYFENFAGCSDGEYLLAGLWHPATLGDCSPGQPGCGLYFGQDAPVCPYDTGGSVGGIAVSPLIDLFGLGPFTLTFDYRIESEGGCDYDLATVLIGDADFINVVPVAESGACGTPTELEVGVGWTSASVDLSAWAGSPIRLVFGFNTFDPFLNNFFGFAVTNVRIEAAGANALSLEGVDCQDDFDPVTPGYQVAVSLWMRGVQAPGATGFQAFIEFDETALAFRDDLSTYAPAPFPQHILNFGALPPFEVEWAPGRLRLDGSTAPLDPPASGDALLATLVFDVVSPCAVTALDFGGYPDPPFFFSELSLFGSPLTTALAPTGQLVFDDTPPSISCGGDWSVPAQVSIPICDISDCCSVHSAGCSEAVCEEAVCSFDSFCCNAGWDGTCVEEALELCGNNPCLGAVVSFAFGAADFCTPPTIVATPPSGSIFPIGTTTVTVTATDACGNSASCNFDITVKPTNEVFVDLSLLVGSFSAPTATRCIRFQTDDCSFADVEIDFTNDGLGFQSRALFVEIPCGDWTSLCAKDEQHTKWATASLEPLGSIWTASPMTLLPGDTDNDGDVDINDVTWLVFTYSDPAVPGPCPFELPGWRDADFSLNGVVSAEDYSLMSAEFLTFSSCGCAQPATGRPRGEPDRRRSLPVHELAPHVRDRVDLNGDGLFDAEDVAVFEAIHALPPVLSEHLRAQPAERTGMR